MWAACLEGRELFRALAAGCRCEARRQSFRGMCGMRWKPNVQEEREAAPDTRFEPATGAPAGEDPSWHKRGILSLWPPIVPPS